MHRPGRCFRQAVIRESVEAVDLPIDALHRLTRRQSRTASSGWARTSPMTSSQPWSVRRSFAATCRRTHPSAAPFWRRGHPTSRCDTKTPILGGTLIALKAATRGWLARPETVQRHPRLNDRPGSHAFPEVEQHRREPLLRRMSPDRWAPSSSARSVVRLPHSLGRGDTDTLAVVTVRWLKMRAVGGDRLGPCMLHKSSWRLGLAKVPIAHWPS